MASKLFSVSNWYHFDAFRWNFHFFRYLTWKCSYFDCYWYVWRKSFILYAVRTKNMNYHLLNCIAITICSIYLRNLESICCKWRDQTTNFWFFTRFPWQIWQHYRHIFQSSISLNFKKDVIFDKSSFRRCNFVYSNIVSYNLKEKWKIYVVQCSFRQARRKRGAVAPPVFSRTVTMVKWYTMISFHHSRFLHHTVQG